MMQLVHKPLALFLVLVFNIFALGITGNRFVKSTDDQIGKTYKFVNGHWFDGKGFQRRTFYSAGGILSQKKPRNVDEIVDLTDGYVIPPFADAHNHHFDAPYNIKQQVEMYLRDGVFYSKVLTNSRKGALRVAGQVNKPTSVDVSYAHGGLTSNYSFPVDLYEALVLGFYTPEQQKANADKIWESRRLENDVYYIIETSDDLERKWSHILEGRPDFIKVYVRHSERYAEGWGRKGRGGGIDPRILPAIVEKAHLANLRVSAGVSTAYDYHVSLLAGVDEFSHPPGDIAEDENVRRYEISKEDAKLTAKRGVFVHILTPAFKPEALTAKSQREKDNLFRNYKLLKAHGVKFAIGSTTYGETPLAGAIALSKLDLFTNLELLKIWCELSPQTIFPNRRIGRLQQGYEASFIVLAGNPLKNFDEVKNIKLRFKQGYFLTSGEKKP